MDKQIQYAEIDALYLDPTNPRLGRLDRGRKTRQSEILDMMRDWSLEELAVSFLESGFWLQEPLLIVEEELYGTVRPVVVEGNRRLAAIFLSQ